MKFFQTAVNLSALRWHQHQRYVPLVQTTLSAAALRSLAMQTSSTRTVLRPTDARRHARWTWYKVLAHRARVLLSADVRPFFVLKITLTWTTTSKRDVRLRVLLSLMAFVLRVLRP